MRNEALSIPHGGGTKVMLLLALITRSLCGDHALASAAICERM